MPNATPDRSGQPKMQFKCGIFIADEHGSIYYAERKEIGLETIVFTKVSTQSEKFGFDSVNELHDKKIFPKRPEENDRSVAIVKMMLALGVSTAALPSGIIKNPRGFTNLATSYIINLGSFDKENQPFWPDSDMAGDIGLNPEPRSDSPPGRK